MRTSFLEFFARRLSEDMNQSGLSANNSNQVTAPTDPKEIQRRKAVTDITSNLMKKNTRLKPGGTDPNTVANLTASDPTISKADPATQQAVSAFFLKPNK